jgi:hypothetical protein
MSLSSKLKAALNENRLLILGAEILMGFQLNAAFVDGFDRLEPHAQLLDGIAYALMGLTVGLLIAPSMQHRLVEYGEDTPRLLHAATVFAAAALLPLGICLGLDVLIAFEKHFGFTLAAIAGATCFTLAMLWWFGLEWLWRRDDLMRKPMKSAKTPLETRIEQLLTEARLLIPGAQALLGFQMAVMLTSAFDKVEPSSKLVHAAALCCIVLATILLMAPAAFHRLAYGGEDSEEFHALGTKLVVASALPIAAGISADLYVVLTKVSGSPLAGAIMAGAMAVVLIALWYVQPLLLRRKRPS